MKTLVGTVGDPSKKDEYARTDVVESMQEPIFTNSYHEKSSAWMSTIPASLPVRRRNLGPGIRATLASSSTVLYVGAAEPRTNSKKKVPGNTQLVASREEIRAASNFGVWPKFTYMRELASRFFHTLKCFVLTILMITIIGVFLFFFGGQDDDDLYA